MFESNSHFSDGLDLLRKKKRHSLVEFVYYAAEQNIPIETVKNSCMWHKGTLFASLDGKFCYSTTVIINEDGVQHKNKKNYSNK